MPAASQRSTFHNLLAASVRPSVLGALIWLIPLFFISPGLSDDKLPMLPVQRASEEDFIQLNCNGTYKFDTFIRLQAICEKCYSYFKNPSIYVLCRTPCFTSAEFSGCIETLQMKDKKKMIYDWVLDLAGIVLEII